MARIQIANNFRTTLAADLPIDGTELILTDITGKPELQTPHDYCIMTLVDLQGNKEFVKVTAWNDSQNKATIVRGQEGTTPRVFVTGSIASNRFTAGTHKTYLESWHTRETRQFSRVNDTKLTINGADVTDEYLADRGIRLVSDSTEIDLYITSSIYNTPNTEVIVSGIIPTSLKTIELGPNVNWMPRNANAATSDNSNLLDGNPSSYYATSASVSNLPNFSVASQQDAEDGIVDNKLMTPLKTKAAIDALVPVATQSSAGKVMLANKQELVEGTNSTKAITPSVIKESLLFPGMIIPYSGSVSSDGHPIPRGMVENTEFGVCDGRSYTASDGVQVTTPNLRDKFLVGAGDLNTVGQTGGYNEVPLTVANIPRHTHGIYALSQNGDITNSDPTGASIAGDRSGYAASYKTSGSHSNSLISYEGSDTPHENRPPYYALVYLMKL